jgi:threo-3-hydroxy-L-aspartate ammonia-lyase
LSGDSIDLSDIQKAAARLEGVAHRTPILTSRTLDECTGLEVLLKAENLQRSGSFKIRGAFNKISSLAPAELARGVATYSSGNHAQAVALAARLVGTTAVILMPSDAPDAKVEATRAYGAEVVKYDRYAQDRKTLGETLALQRGCVLVSPYDDQLVIAGQGTVALELMEDCGPLDVIVVPVGGGGLIAGCATAATAMHPGTRIVGVEPVTGDDTKRSLDAGKLVRIAVPQTIADGQQVDMPGEITFGINQRLVDEIVLVTDEEIIEAMAFAFDYMKTVVEPSGASALAAVLRDKLDVDGARAGVVLSGGNLGSMRLAQLLSQPGSPT